MNSKTIILILIIFSLTYRFSFGQNYISIYKQPDSIKGYNLILSTNSNFNNNRPIYSTKPQIDYNFNINTDYNLWSLSANLNYAVRATLKAGTKRNPPIDLIAPIIPQTDNA